MLGLLLAAALLTTDGGVSNAPAGLRFVVPEVLSTIDIPGEQKALGVPMKLIAVRSKLGVDDVRLALMKQFHQAGLYVPPPEDITLHEVTVVALDPVTLTAYSAVLRPNGDGSSTVVLGESYLSRTERSGLPDWGPVYPGAKSVMTTDVELMQTATYVVSQTADEVRKFYDQVMTGAGFAKRRPDLYVRGDEVISVTYTSLSPSDVGVLVSRQRGVHDD